MPHGAARKPQPLSSLGPDQLRALRERHDPRHRIVVDTIGEWRVAVLPHGSPRWREQRTEGALDRMRWSPARQATLVTPSAATDGHAEARVGPWVGRFCGIPCACRWLVDAHQLPGLCVGAVHRAWTHLVLAHSVLA